METAWIEIIREIGPFAGIMMFFVWRDYKREDRLETRVDELNSFVREELMTTINRNTEALAKWKTEISREH